MSRPPGKVGVAVALIVVFLLVRAVRPDAEQASSTSAPPQALAALPTDTSTPPAERTAPSEPSLGKVVRTAADDARRSVDALGSSGARLYSENCYAALASKSFEGVRDRCYAFDRIAGRLLDEAGDLSEVFWFSEQSAVSRYRQSFDSRDTDVDARIARVNAAVAALGPVAAPTDTSAEVADPMENSEAVPAYGGEALPADELEADGTDGEVTAPGGADPAF